VPVDLKTTIALLNDPKFFDLVMAAAGFGRSFPPKDALKEKPDHSRVMQQAVVRHRVKGNINTDASLAAVYKKGWLHAEQNSGGEVEYIFPTEIHRLYSLRKPGCVDCAHRYIDIANDSYALFHNHSRRINSRRWTLFGGRCYKAFRATHSPAAHMGWRRAVFNGL
jgi:hypothetical protein